MRAVVTGGAGFVGSHLVEYLLGHGHEVVALDDLSGGSASNLEAVAAHPGFRLVRGSILDAALVEEVVRQCDTVFHLAAALGVQRIVDDPVTALRVNLHGTEVVLGASARHGCRFLFSSSSEVYGKNGADLLGEGADVVLGSPLKSRWSYATAKAIDELLTFWSRETHGHPAVIARLFNVVGPRQTGRYGMVVPRFVAAALAGKPLTVFGDGLQRRCFCSVHDVVPALAALVETPRAYGRAVNLGGSEEMTILGLAERVRGLLGSGSDIVHVPYELAYGAGYEEIYRRVPDTTLAHDLVGFAAQTGLDEIIHAIATDAQPQDQARIRAQEQAPTQA